MDVPCHIMIIRKVAVYGSNNSASSYFNCKLYKGDTVIASTMIGTPLLMEGEYFEDESAYFWSLPPGDYTIKLLDR